MDGVFAAATANAARRSGAIIDVSILAQRAVSRPRLRLTLIAAPRIAVNLTFWTLAAEHARKHPERSKKSDAEDI